MSAARGEAAPPLPAASGADDDSTVSMVAANVAALAILPLAAVPVAAHVFVHGGPSLERPLWLLAFLVVYPLSVAVHEGLHALGFLAGGASRADVRFGIDRQTMSPFAGCRVPLRARWYRLAVALPGLVLGAAPLALGLATGAFWWTLYGAVLLHAATGDACALWAMRRVPSGALVLDHPERVGCRVVPG